MTTAQDEDALWREIRTIQSLTHTRTDESRGRMMERVDAQLAAWVEQVDVSARDTNGNTALLWVVLVGFRTLPRLIARLLARGADPNACNDERWSPLHVAAARRIYGPAALDVLLGAGSDPDARQCDGQTPLHVAAIMDGLDCVQRLLEAGADARARDDAGRLPLDLAADPAVQESLEEAGLPGRRRTAPQRVH